jgi:hypothetical protein
MLLLATVLAIDQMGIRSNAHSLVVGMTKLPIAEENLGIDCSRITTTLGYAYAIGQER